MSEWREYQVGEIIELIDGDRGKNYPQKNEFLHKGFCLFLNTGNVTEDGFNFTNTAFISKEKDNLLRKGKLNRNDVVLTTRGTIGNVAYYNRNVPFEHIRINSGMLLVREKGNIVSRYIYYLFKSTYMQQQFKQFSSGSAQPQLPVKDLVCIPVIIPNIQTQEKTVSLISAYDDLIDNNKRRIAILEEMTQRLYREWFVHFRFPGHQNVKIIESDMGLIPKGWEITTLGKNIQSVRKGLSRKKMDDGMIYVGIEHLPRKKMIILDHATAASIKSNKLLFSTDDVLFGKIRPYFHKIAIAPFSGCCSTDILVLQIKENRYAYDYLTLFSDEFIAFATQVSQGTKMPRAEWGILKNYKYTCPPASLIHKFSAIADPFIQEIKYLTLKNANLRKTRDLLLPRMISGEIDVSELDVIVRE